MKPTYFVRSNGRFYEVWDNQGDWVENFDTEGDALACIAFLESEDERIRQQWRSAHE